MVWISYSIKRYLCTVLQSHLTFEADNLQDGTARQGGWRDVTVMCVFLDVCSICYFHELHDDMGMSEDR